MGPERTTRRAAEQLRKGKSLIDGWSSKHQWVIRVRAWDEHLEQVTALAPSPTRDDAIGRLEAQLAALSLPAAEFLNRLETQPNLFGDIDTTQLLELVIKTTRPLADLLKEVRALRGESQESANAQGAAVHVHLPDEKPENKHDPD